MRQSQYETENILCQRLFISRGELPNHIREFIQNQRKMINDLLVELGSGTVKELDAGVHAIGKKIVEEAAEVWMAAEYESKADLALEISQLLYHLQVMMVAKEVSLDDIYKYL